MSANIDYLFNNPFNRINQQTSIIDSEDQQVNSFNAKGKETKTPENVTPEGTFQLMIKDDESASVAIQTLDNSSQAVQESVEKISAVQSETPKAPSFKEYTEKMHSLYSFSLSMDQDKIAKRSHLSDAIQKHIPSSSWLYDEDLVCKRLSKLKAEYRERFSDVILLGKSTPSLISFCNFADNMFIPECVKNSESFAKKIIDIDPIFIQIAPDSIRTKIHCDHEFIQNVMEEHTFSTTLEQADWNEFWKFALDRPENVQFLRKAFSEKPSYISIFSKEVKIAVAFENPREFQKITKEIYVYFDSEGNDDKIALIGNTALKYPHIKQELDSKAQQLKSYSAALEAILQQEEQRQSEFHIEVRNALDLMGIKKNILKHIEKATNNDFSRLIASIKSNTLFKEVDQRFGENEAWVRSAILAHPNAIMIASDSVRAKIAGDGEFIRKVLDTFLESKNTYWPAFWEAIQDRFPCTRLFCKEEIETKPKYLYTFGIEGILTYAFTRNDLEEMIENNNNYFPEARKAEFRTGLLYRRLADAYPYVMKKIEEQLLQSKSYIEVLEQILEAGKNLHPVTSEEKEIANFYHDAQIIPHAVQVPVIIGESLMQLSAEKDVDQMIKERTLFAAIDPKVCSSKIWLREAVMTHPNVLYLASDDLKKEIAQDTQFITQVLTKFRKRTQNIDWNAFWGELKGFSTECLAFMESKILEDPSYVTTFSSEGILNLALNRTKKLFDINENLYLVSNTQKKIIEEALVIAKIIQKYPEIQKTLEQEHQAGKPYTEALQIILDGADKNSDFYLEAEKARTELELKRKH